MICCTPLSNGFHSIVPADEAQFHLLLSVPVVVQVVRVVNSDTGLGSMIFRLNFNTQCFTVHMVIDMDTCYGLLVAHGLSPTPSLFIKYIIGLLLRS